MEKKKKSRLSKAGYALLTAIVAVNIFAILIVKARVMWERELIRDLEQELIFRARQYVTAIDLYMKKNANVMPKNLDELLEKKFLRRRFPDPMTLDGTWNLVMRQGQGRGGKNVLLIVPEEMLDEYRGKAMLIGVCSTSPDEGYIEYRKKKRYNEWAIYIGEQPDKEMPELKYVGVEGGDDDSRDDNSRDDESRDTDRNRPDDGRGSGRDSGRERE